MMESGIRLTALFALVLTLGLTACGDASNDAEEAIAKSVDAAAEAVQDANETIDEAAENVAEAVNEAGEAVDEALETIAQELPKGVTLASVAKGKEIYNGAGICMSCHGPEGKGIPNLGANLTDDEWLHSDGSYEGIVKTVMGGVTAQASSSGVPMPAKGGTNISDDDAKAAAAYVWTLSRAQN